MRPPYVGAVVIVRPPNVLEWWAAIITSINVYRKQLSGAGWVDAVDVSIFPPNGGVRIAKMVGRFPERADEDSHRDEYVWRWPEERL